MGGSMFADIRALRLRPWAAILFVALHLPQARECDNRADRDANVEPGGLQLVGVKESPLGFYPTKPVAATHEHFFQQLREVWSDDCPRVLVQVGLQPAAGTMREWSSAALWLRYF